jgi:hypothetical protein
LLFEKKTAKRFVRFHAFAQSPPGRCPNDKCPVNYSYRTSFFVTMFHSPCYLVATVVRILSLRRQICVYNTYFSQYRDTGLGKRNRK